MVDDEHPYVDFDVLCFDTPIEDVPFQEGDRLTVTFKDVERDGDVVTSIGEVERVDWIPETMETEVELSIGPKEEA